MGNATLLHTPLLQISLWNNTIADYSMALIVFVVCVTVLSLVHHVVEARVAAFVARTVTTVDDVFLSLFRSVHPSLYYVIAVVIALQWLTLLPWLDAATVIALFVVGIFYIAHAIGVLIQYFAIRSFGTEHAHARSALGLVIVLVRIAVWIFGILLILSNLGVNVLSVIAGLGIGGIAVALALQNILKDIFASFSIFFDQPFTVGDFIDTGQEKGTVTHIGLKTTRLKALSGEEIIIPNQNLTAVRLRNYGRMQRRRVSFGFGIAYETPIAIVHAIPEMIAQIITPIDKVSFGWARFKSIGDSALLFDVVYFVETGDYRTFIDVRQHINFALLERFAAAGISFAYPTQRVYHTSVRDAQ